MQDGGGAGGAPFAPAIQVDLAAPKARRRIAALGVSLRQLRRHHGDGIVEMRERLAAQPFGEALGLSAEALSAFERGDAAPRGIGRQSR